MASVLASCRRLRSPPDSCPNGKGLHSSTFQLNVSAFCGIEGCDHGLFKGCLGGNRQYQDVFRVYFAWKTAQVEFKSGRV